MAVCAVAFFFWENRKAIQAKDNATKIIKEAEDKAIKITKEAENKASSSIESAKKESYEILAKAEKIEQRAIEKEWKLDAKMESFEARQEKLTEKENFLKNKEEKIDEVKTELEWKLSEIAKLSEKEARELFLKEIEEKYEEDWKILIAKHKKRIEDNKKEVARDIIIKSIQQYAWDVTSEVTTTVIPLPNDDMKWKLIWKEWRNITTFEKAAWVALIIDDTPDSVFISAFDLFRRYIAKKSLEKLIEDGRIQPARIEEIVAKTEEEADLLLKEMWEKVLDELWITSLPDEIVPIVWKLRFRTSYWQNILKHSKETALIAEALAAQLWADSNIAKISWLLHDIGKALDQEYEWTHPEIWWILARKYKLNPKIIDAIENHHWEQFSISLEAAIVQVADAISSVRPGARREVIEDYLKRVQEMEALVSSFSWVNKAYALSAGKEIRVFVDAETISDMEAITMARQIADNIQEKLSYPWEVKVNLIREMRVIEVAK